MYSAPAFSANAPPFFAPYAGGGGSSGSGSSGANAGAGNGTTTSLDSGAIAGPGTAVAPDCEAVRTLTIAVVVVSVLAAIILAWCCAGWVCGLCLAPFAACGLRRRKHEAVQTSDVSVVPVKGGIAFVAGDRVLHVRRKKGGGGGGDAASIVVSEAGELEATNPLYAKASGNTAASSGGPARGPAVAGMKVGAALAHRRFSAVLAETAGAPRNPVPANPIAAAAPAGAGIKDTVITAGLAPEERVAVAFHPQRTAGSTRELFSRGGGGRGAGR